MLMSLASSINMMFDRIMLRDILPEGFYPGQSAETALGIYGNVYKLSIFMSLVVQAFKFAAEPFFFANAENRNSPVVFADIMKWFIIACVLIWVFVSLNLDLVAQLTLRNPLYWAGLSVVPILLLANLFLGVYYNLSVWFKLVNKTYYGTYLTLMGLGVTILLNYLLIPKLGYLGCAVSFAVSAFLMMLICYLLGQKHYPVSYHVKSAAGYVLAGGLLIGLSAQVQIDSLWVAVPYHLLLCLLFVLGVLVVERERLLPARFRRYFD
jgi:O-antigen/teichoic acid export membrane protein